jgi:AcrR family transcriptional regulator
MQTPWIDAGYRAFAYEGPQNLKIERLSKEIGKNKSSFYHYFADLDVFRNILLKHHLQQAQLMAVKESECATLEELIDILVAHKTDLLFNRQLRIHRQDAEFRKCFEKTNEITAQSIIRIWAEILDLKDNSYLAGLVLKLSIDNLFLQLTDETLNQNWLRTYFNELRGLIRAFKNNMPVSLLDGTG